MKLSIYGYFKVWINQCPNGIGIFTTPILPLHSPGRLHTVFRVERLS